VKGNRCAKEDKWGSRDQLTAQHLGPSRKQYHPEGGQRDLCPWPTLCPCGLWGYSLAREGFYQGQASLQHDKAPVRGDAGQSQPRRRYVLAIENL
jgi:hypothetical protein